MPDYNRESSDKATIFSPDKPTTRKDKPVIKKEGKAMTTASTVSNKLLSPIIGPGQGPGEEIPLSTGSPRGGKCSKKGTKRTKTPNEHLPIEG